MNNKKLKMIFDVSILANFKTKNGGRSGIYFTALNILENFIKSNKFNMTLYCKPDRYNQCVDFIESFIKNKLGSADIKVVTDMSGKQRVYAKLKKARDTARDAKENFFKNFIQLQLIFFKLFIFIERLFTAEKLCKDYDIFFSPVYAVPSYFKKCKNIKKYTILYDTIPLFIRNYNGKRYSSAWYDNLIKSFNKDDYYFAISECAKKDFLNEFPAIDKHKITTALLACSENFYKADNLQILYVKKKYNIPQESKYIFSLSNLDKRKNMVRIIKTFTDFVIKNNISDLYFVIGGSDYKVLYEQLQSEINNFENLEKYIILTGYVDDEDLSPLYSGAEWFVYTSQYEGFGLPPLEAMSCGCPVITSNNSSLPEVVGDAGLMIDWNSDEQHVKAYEKYYYDTSFRNNMAQKGLERSKLFSWEKCANIMIEVMTK